MKHSTLAVQLGTGYDCKTGSISVPIYQNATFRHPGLGQSTGFDYSRSGNPTRKILEDGMASLDGGARGFAFSSGMAAITGIMYLFKPGDHIIVTEDIYGGTRRLFEKVFRDYGLKFSYVDTSDISLINKNVNSSTRAVFIETLTNPLLKFADPVTIASLCRDKKILLIADNTFLTPYLFRPLEYGADITLYSATKYLSGHNDTVAGIAVVKDPELAEKVYFYQNASGAVPGPQDSWLVIRGMKTLGIRLDRQQENALKISKWLCSVTGIEKVYYPGLENHPGHDLMKRYTCGFGGMISFEVSSTDLVPRILERVRLISFAESLGGVESLITYPETQTHADIPPEIRTTLGINNRLLRLSAGIEDADDIIDDLKQAIKGE